MRRLFRFGDFDRDLHFAAAFGADPLFRDSRGTAVKVSMEPTNVRREVMTNLLRLSVRTWPEQHGAN